MLELAHLGVAEDEGCLGGVQAGWDVGDVERGVDVLPQFHYLEFWEDCLKLLLFGQGFYGSGFYAFLLVDVLGLNGHAEVCDLDRVEPIDDVNREVNLLIQCTTNVPDLL